MNTEHNTAIKIINFGLLAFAVTSPLSLFGAEMCIVIVVLGWLYKIIKEKSLSWNKSPIDIFIVVYLATQFSASLISIAPADAVRATLDTEWPMFLFFAVVNNLRDEKVIRKIVYCMILFSVFASMYALWEYFSGWDIIRQKKLAVLSDIAHYRAEGFFEFYLTFAGYISVVLLISIGLLASVTTVKEKIFLSVASTILFLAILATYARSMLLALAFVGIIFAVLKGKKNGLIILATGIIMFFFLSFFIPSFYNRATSAFSASENIDRINVYKTCINIAKDYPFFGVGVENFLLYYDHYKVPGNKLRSPHNDYFNALVNSGIIGVSAFLFMWGAFLYFCIKEFYKMQDSFHKNLLLGCLLGIIALLLGSMFQGYYTDIENGMQWWFIAGIAMTIVSKEKIRRESQ